MIFRPTRGRYAQLFGGTFVALATVCAGCETPPKAPSRTPIGRTEIDSTKIPTRDDIVQIIQYWPQVPWLQERERIVGFRVPVYFVSGQTEKGAFVPGNIYVWVYELVPGEDGRRQRKLVHMWEFDQGDALGFRVNKRAVGGYFYGFPLTWPKELALEGKEIEVQFGYERTDKGVLLSPPRRFSVPVPAGYQPPVEGAER
ncbi:MAG: hypothetical protein ACE5I3_01995 [Phycisphaerae bacterium]